MGAAGQRFGPDARLRKRAEFRRVYDEGRRLSGRYFVCFFREAASPDDRPRLGITVTRRMGAAVRRNRLRRLAREFFRLRRGQMRAGFDVVINARPQAAVQPASVLWEDLERVFVKAGATPGGPERRR